MTPPFLSTSISPSLGSWIQSTAGGGGPQGEGGSGSGVPALAPGGPGSDPTNQGAQAKPASPCQGRILDALHQVLGNFTAVATDQTSRGIRPAVNVFVHATNLDAQQFNSLKPGARWSLNSGFAANVLGIGPSLHIASPSSQFDKSWATFNNSNIGGDLSVNFTAHIDSGNPNRPIGFLTHFFIDVVGVRPRSPC
jgi:hypothetical protein